MFTGIVRAVGRVESVQPADGAMRLSISTGDLPTEGWQVGDSVAVAGVCLTVTGLVRGRFDALASAATLAVTNLAELRLGAAVNLEPAVTAQTPLGGHLVTGHIDGIATAGAVTGTGGARHAAFSVPPALARYLAVRGSVALDGVSLTVSDAAGAVFGVQLLPHTCAATTLGELATGRRVNLEVDLVARYVDRLLEARSAP